MDKKTMLKIFGEAFLRSFVVLMAIVIVGFAAFFIINVKSNDKNKQVAQTTQENTTASEITTEEVTTEEVTTEEVTTEEPTTEEVTTEEPDIPSTDKKIMLLNSTNVAGLAKGWSAKLNGAGFAQTITGNFTAGAYTQTKIYVPEEGMGKDLVTHFKDAVLEVGKPSAGTYSPSSGMSEEGVSIYIVIGNNDSTVQ